MEDQNLVPDASETHHAPAAPDTAAEPDVPADPNGLAAQDTAAATDADEEFPAEEPEFDWSQFDWHQFLDWRWITGGVLALALLVYAMVPASKPPAPPLDAAAQAPAVLPSLLTLSLQYYQAKRYDEAIVLGKAMVEHDPNSAEAYNNLGVSYAALSQWDDAQVALQAAVRIKPDFQLAKNNLAWIDQEIQKAKLGTQSPEFYLNKSLGEYRTGKYQECVDDAQKALKVKPDFAEAYNNMAVAQLMLRHYDAAIAAAQNALRVKPDFPMAKANLAWAQSEKQQAAAKGSVKP